MIRTSQHEKETPSPVSTTGEEPPRCDHHHQQQQGKTKTDSTSTTTIIENDEATTTTTTTNVTEYCENNSNTKNPDNNDDGQSLSSLMIMRGIDLNAKIDYYIQYGQTDPPTIPIEELFSSNTNDNKEKSVPRGQILPYHHHHHHHHSTTTAAHYYEAQEGQSTFRETPVEGRAQAREIGQEDIYTKFRQAAEVHRQVRGYVQKHLLQKPGIPLLELCEKLETKTRQLVHERGLKAGIAFPTGCSINEIAAHDTPNNPRSGKTVLGYDDVMKLDFGVQINGYIIDSAFTIAYNPKYDNLLQACREATNTGIQEAGIDARFCDLGSAIQETMDSYEVVLNGQTYPIKPIRNLKGHSIERYRIHGKHRVPVVGGRNDYYNGGTGGLFCRLGNWMFGYDEDESAAMEEGQVYAIETFGSTGRGYVVPEGMGRCSHYMKNPNVVVTPSLQNRLPDKTKRLLSHIDKTFGNLCFCRRWLERDDGGSAYVNGVLGKQTNYMGSLLQLCDEGIIDAYPPLMDIPGSYTAQYEHTLILRPTCKEVLSRGYDY